MPDLAKITDHSLIVLAPGIPLSQSKPNNTERQKQPSDKFKTGDDIYHLHTYLCAHAHSVFQLLMGNRAPGARKSVLPHSQSTTEEVIKICNLKLKSIKLRCFFVKLKGKHTSVIEINYYIFPGLFLWAGEVINHPREFYKVITVYSLMIVPSSSSSFTPASCSCHLAESK